MIGVVLWSDQADGKAVFWCEDQGDLAYFEGGSLLAEGDPFFDAGDMVQFDVFTEARVRKAQNARLVQERAYVGLPESLRKGAAPQEAAPPAPQSAQIIPFGYGARPGHQSEPARRRKA